MRYRQEICDFLSQEFKKLSGEIECNERYCGSKRKGMRDHRSAVRSIITTRSSRDAVIVTVERGSGHVHRKDAYSTIVLAKIISYCTLKEKKFRYN